LSDISDGSDTNFIYILLASKCQQRNNEEHFRTNKTPNKLTVCLESNSWVTWLKLLGSKLFCSLKMRALSWEQVVWLRIVPENH